MYPILLKYFSLYKKLCLPGIGSLVMDDSALPFNESQASIIFNPHGEDYADTVFTQFIAKELELSEFKAINHFHDYAFELKNNIRSKGFVSLEDIGMLYRKKIGGIGFTTADVIPDNEGPHTDIFATQLTPAPEVELPTIKKPEGKTTHETEDITGTSTTQDRNAFVSTVVEAPIVKNIAPEKPFVAPPTEAKIIAKPPIANHEPVEQKVVPPPLNVAQDPIITTNNDNRGTPPINNTPHTYIQHESPTPAAVPPAVVYDGRYYPPQAPVQVQVVIQNDKPTSIFQKTNEDSSATNYNERTSSPDQQQYNNKQETNTTTVHDHLNTLATIRKEQAQQKSRKTQQAVGDDELIDFDATSNKKEGILNPNNFYEDDHRDVIGSQEYEDGLQYDGEEIYYEETFNANWWVFAVILTMAGIVGILLHFYMDGIKL